LVAVEAKSNLSSGFLELSNDILILLSEELDIADLICPHYNFFLIVCSFKYFLDIFFSAE